MNRNRESKTTAQSITCRKNICFFLSLKHQLKLAYQFISNDVLSDSFNFGRKIILSKFTVDKITNILINNNYLLHDLNHVKFISWVDAYGTLYVNDLTLLFNMEAIPNFITIKYVFLTDELIPYLICSKLNTLEFNEHMQAFKVTMCSDLICFTINNELTSSIFHKSKNGSNFVSFR